MAEGSFPTKVKKVFGDLARSIYLKRMVTLLKTVIVRPEPTGAAEKVRRETHFGSDPCMAIEEQKLTTRSAYKP